MSTISTHVMDTARGCPADGMPVALERYENKEWNHVGGGTTEEDGCIGDLVPEGVSLEDGTYRITFDTGTYYAVYGMDGFYPVVRVVFVIKDTQRSFHVPLLLSPFGYSTYFGD